MVLPKDCLFHEGEAVLCSFPQLQAVADRIVLVPNGIKLEQYQKPVSPAEKAALFQRYGLMDEGYTLVMVTRVSREKNIMEILRFLPALLEKLPKPPAT